MQKLTFGLSCLFFFVLLLSKPCCGQETESSSKEDTEAGSQSSDVDLLIRLNQILEKDKGRLSQLTKDSMRLEPLFKRKSEQFYTLDGLRDSLVALSDTIQMTAVQLEWDQEKNMLDFLLNRRRSIHQQIKILRLKIDKLRESIDFLLKGQRANVLDIAAIGMESATASDSLNTLPPDSVRQDDLIQYNWRVVEAERELTVLKAKFEYLKKGWLLAEQLMALNQDDLNTTNTMAENTSKQLEVWEGKLDEWKSEYAVLEANDSARNLQQLFKKSIEETERFSTTLEDALANDSTEIENLEARVEYLSDLADKVSEDIAEASKQIDKQNRWLEFLKSPFAPYRLYYFFINKGPSIVFIIIGLVLFWFVGRWMIHKVINGVIRYKSKEERKERVETLSRATQSALTVVIILSGVVAILSQVGIDVSVLLGGAAVFSLALAFGAQSLVKDFFSGFMILSENQYRVGNIVRINGIEGTVEDISLRTTILRDLEGVAHFIPHGEITMVSNLAHGWSQVVLEVGVAYKENVDHVMEVIMELAHGLKEDGQYKNMVTGEPIMLGVDNFGDSAVVIKLLVKTRPLKQWAVKRQLLRRIKLRFDELGIEIPFPHRTVFYQEMGREEDKPKLE